MQGTELVPAVVAVGGGAALVGGIAIYERNRERAMKANRDAFSVVFPIGMESAAAMAALKSLPGMGSTYEIVVEVVADEDGIHHLLHLPAPVSASIIDQLTAAIPGLRVDPVDARPTGPVTAAARIRVPVGAHLRDDDAEAASRAILAGLGSLHEGERVSVRWALRPGPAPTATTSKNDPASMQSRAVQKAVRASIGEPGYTAAGLILGRAEDPARARALITRQINVIRSRRGVGSGLIIRRGSVRTTAVMPATGRSRGWLSAAELLPVLGWPLSADIVPGLELGAARRLPVPREVGRHGRRLLVGHDAYGDRVVALDVEAAKHHMAVVGPSGTGKSVLVGNCMLDDIGSGYGGVSFDPKNDTHEDVLERVPKEHADRIVVLDPGADGPVPGIDLLGVGDPDLRTDVVMGALGAIFKDSWGVRTETYLRLGLRTVSELPKSERVLTNWLRLFSDEGFRRRAVGRLTDPLLVTAWASYEAMSPQEQSHHIAAPMSKVISLLSRPAVRKVLAQSDPKLDIARLLAERKWLLINLSPGLIGEPAARLLGAVMTYVVWTAVEARAAVPKEKSQSVFLYVDELTSLANLPFGIEYLFERARGLGCGVTVATQALGRLPADLRMSLLGNVGTLVTFRLNYEEATKMGHELPGLGAQDIQALRRFEVAARVGTGSGSGVAVVTGSTQPLPASTGMADAIKKSSAARYGQDVAAMDEELRRVTNDETNEPDEPVGRTRRLP